ncbi:MAG: DUF1428 domain-containing protein [Xanthomonadales bacterium]|nr:DUF1428 domain-containing protein [Xanthomonadales bacterium]
MAYVDGFLLAIPGARLGDYRRIARLAGTVWKEHGALAYVECVADDLTAEGAVTFPKALKLKPGEVVVFSWIVHASKAARARTNRKAMADPRLASLDPKTMPCDPRRMTWGGFRPIVEL